MARDMSGGDRVVFSSAGTHALDGNPATRTGRVAAATLGLELGEHRARQLTSEMVRDAEIIFVMEQVHRDHVLTMDAGADVRLLDPGESEIPDPYGGELDSYLAAYELIRQALDAHLAEFG